jgi:hypothetical protein
LQASRAVSIGFFVLPLHASPGFIMKHVPFLAGADELGDRPFRLKQR